MIKFKPSSIAIHITGWVIFLSLPVIFIASRSLTENGLRSFNWIYYCLFFSVYVFIFYLHTYALFPGLYLRKRFFLYFFSMAFLLAGVFFLKPFDKMVSKHMLPTSERNIMVTTPPPGEYRPPPPGNNDRKGPALDIISIALFILTIAISIAIVMEKRWHQAVQKAAMAETDKANAELSFLKAQINPHFLFNTLNNIYSLAITKNENVADAILKLSNIMRYVTDDVNETYVSLESELNAVNDYISLQKLRLGKKANADFIVNGNIDNKKIAPLILIPFVENVFKHGLSNAEESNIIIKLDANEKSICFFTQNKLFATPRITERAGIGNANTKKRLDYIYPGKHQLDITAENGLFTVQLVLYI